MKFRIYKDRKKEWRWQLQSKNGKFIADSGEGYKNKKDCIAMVQKVAPEVEFVVEQPKK